MMSYTSDYRPEKRKNQNQLTEILREHNGISYKPGKVIVLSGPDPVGAVEQYRKSGLAEQIVLVEKDAKTYKIARKKISDLPVYKTDIFSLLRTKRFEDISGLDLDFCETLNAKLLVDITEAIKRLMRNNKLPSFWLRITNSPRKIGTYNTHLAIEKLKTDVLGETDYQIVDEYFSTYRDTKHMTMHMWQGFFINTGKPQEKAPRGEREMESRNRTLSDLNTAEQNMVRILIATTNCPEEMEAIAKKFKLSRTTMAALKAHKTRQETR